MYVSLSLPSLSPLSVLSSTRIFSRLILRPPFFRLQTPLLPLLDETTGTRTDLTFPEAPEEVTTELPLPEEVTLTVDDPLVGRPRSTPLLLLGKSPIPLLHPFFLPLLPCFLDRSIFLLLTLVASSLSLCTAMTTDEVTTGEGTKATSPSSSLCLLSPLSLRLFSPLLSLLHAPFIPTSFLQMTCIPAALSLSHWDERPLLTPR
jgi:hypothetical protein